MTTRRYAWMAAHVSLGVLFVAFAAWHLGLVEAGQFADRPSTSSDF